MQTERLSVAERASAGDAAWLAGQICREVEEAAEVKLQLDPAGEMVRRVESCWDTADGL